MRPSVLPIAVSLVLAGAVARAAPATKDRRATAAALFQRGLADIEAGKVAQGCDELAESVATLPDSGAMGSLAECETTLGRLSEAWELWRDLAHSAPSAELRDDAAKNAAALDRKLARVVLHARGVAPADLVVTLNGKPASLQTATEPRVVPGPLVVVASSPEIVAWTHSFTTRPGAAIEIELPLVPSGEVVHRQSRGRLLGWSLIGAGVVALGVGAVYGGLAYSDWHSASASCGGSTDQCKTAGYADAQRELSSARKSATISTWVTGAGALAGGLGLVLYLSFRDAAPRTESATAWRAMPVASPDAFGLVLARSLP